MDADRIERLRKNITFSRKSSSVKANDDVTLLELLGEGSFGKVGDDWIREPIQGYVQKQIGGQGFVPSVRGPTTMN